MKNLINLINELKKDIQNNCRENKQVTVGEYIANYLQKGYERQDIERALKEVMKSVGAKDTGYYT